MRAHALAGEPQVDFVRRVITRPCDGQTEEHDSLSDAAFAKALAEGAFALSWEAHGLCYGLPAEIDLALDNGHVAVANLSRGALPALRERYANVAVVEITADPEILAARLAGAWPRIRAKRCWRGSPAPFPAKRPAAPSRIDNSGAPEIAGDKLVGIIRKAMAFADISGTV